MAYIRSRKHAAASPLGAGLAASIVALAAGPTVAATTTEMAALDVSRQDQGQSHAVSGVTVRGRHGQPGKTENVKAVAPLLDTPQTVTVISRELIAAQGATTLTEALQNSPGVGTFYLGENGSTSTGDAVYMRGVDVSGNILVDGVRDVASISRDVFNIDQVEVLKGGAGADIGRGAATGAINLYTKNPMLRDLRTASFSYGSADFRRATADVNMVLNPTSALRINLMSQSAGVPGRDRVDTSRWGVAPALGLGLGTPTRVYLKFQHVTQDNVPDGGVSTIGLPDYASPDPARPYISSAPRVSSKNFYGVDADHDHIRSDMGTVVLEHDFDSHLSIRNLSRWERTTEDYQLSSFLASATYLLTPSDKDLSTWTIDRRINNKDAVNSIWFNQTNLRADFETGSISHAVSGGLELIRETQKNYALAVTGAYPAANLYNPVSAVSGYGRGRSGDYTEGATDTVGLYFNDAITIVPQFIINGGIRLDHFQTDFDTVATGAKTTLSVKDDLVSGRIGAVYKPVNTGSIYVSYAVTKQPPGGANFSLVTTARVDNASVAPQVAKNYEAGTKWEFLRGRLLLAGALYRTEYADQILQDADGSFYRAGLKRIQGIELTVTGSINRNWTINAGYTTMDTHTESPTNTVATADGSATLAYNPTDSLTLWSTYRILPTLSVGGGALYTGELKRGADGAVGTPQYAQAHWVLNGFANWRLTRGVELQFNVYNLLNEQYVAAINKSGYRYTPGVPRSGRVTLNLAF